MLDISEESSERQSLKDINSKSLNSEEKLILRISIVFFIIIITILSFSSKAYKILENSKKTISNISIQTSEQFDLMDKDLEKIKTKTDEYASLIKTVKNLTEIEKNVQEKRIISKYSIPNMLNQIMNLIPKQVKIISIANVKDSKTILIEAESEKYEQLGYFSSILKTENILKNIKSSSGSKKGSTINVTIEGELP